MKIILPVFMLIFSPVALAGSSPFFMALKAGIVDNGSDLTDSAINAAFDIGYTHNKHLATEFEFSRTLVEGSTTNNNNDWTADSWSIFAALRTSGKTKLKVKFGLTDLENNDGLEVSAGIGISYWSLGGLAEVEYTRLDDNITFLSFGVNYFY